MAKLIALTNRIRGDQQQTILVNVDQIRFLQPSSVGGGTLVVFDDQQSVVVAEPPDRIVTLADQ
jgi:hypothetical protein